MSHAETGEAGGRRRRRPLRIVLGTGGVVVVAAGAAAAWGFGGPSQSAAGRSTLPPATGSVTRQTLTQTETVTGTLGYGDATTIASRGGSGAVLTWMPEPGAQISRGQAAYKVDQKPVVLLYGSVPLYRPLAPGDEGFDVRQLENNLSALGYGGFTVDDEYTDATADAVERWQEDLGWDGTGTVTPGQAVVVPGRIRVAQVELHPGDLATGPMLTYTGTTRVVSVDLDVTKQQLVRKGIAATVELPGGKQVAGTVSSVGTVASVPAAGAGGQSDGPTTIDVTVDVKDQKALGGLDEAPVDVVLQSDKREGVLTVPVGALVALTGGGYGVQVVEGATTRYLPVEVGMFAGGRVEISGDGLTEGLTVGVPK